jgi:hypothetical protein
MAKDTDEITRLAQPNLESGLKLWGDWAKGWQAMTAEMSDYTKRSIEDGTQTLEKLIAARTFEQVVEIQSSYARRACEDYIQQMSRMGAMYAEMAKDSAKPFERLVSSRNK